MSDHMGIFRSAVTDRDGSVNVGYLSLFWIMVVVLTVVPVMTGAAIVDAYFTGAPHAFDYRDLGAGVRDVTFGFSTALGALGVFLWGDSRGSVAHTTTTTTVVTPLAPAAQPPADDQAKQLAPRIEPEDVGKAVTIEPAQRRKRD